MRRRGLVAVVALVALLLTACDTDLWVTAPDDGEIVSGETVTVTGAFPPGTPLGDALTVNGIPTAYDAAGNWSQEVPVDPAKDVTMVEVLYPSHRQRIAVVSGPSIPDDGSFSPNGVGMRFTDAGLAGLGPVVQDLAGGAFDIGGLLMSQNPAIDVEDAFSFAGFSFDVTGNVYEAGIGGVAIDTSAAANGVNTSIDIEDLFVGLDLDIDGPINLDCRLELTVDTTNIDATFDLEPDPSDPSSVDVNLVGAPAVTTIGLVPEFISGLCDDGTFAIGGLINGLATSEVSGLVDDGFSDALGDPDGSGPQDSPIADAIETALAEISIAGEVGNAVGVNLAAPLTSITESTSGVELRSNADFFTTVGSGPSDCLPPAHAPDLDETFDVPGAFPTLGATSPGGDPYGLGLAISASAFNQLLGGMTECGFLNQTLSEMPLGGSTLPITAGLLAAFDPGFATLDPALPLEIRVRPTVAPFVTDDAGPNGEAGELMLANLMIDIYDPAATPWGVEWADNLVTLAIDAPLGFDLAYDPLANALAPTITAPTAADVDARVIYNNHLGINEASIEAIFPNLFPLMVDGLGSTFSAFPLPSFLGMDLNVIEVARDSGYFVLYADLDAVPQTRMENATITDLSTGNFADDDPIADSHEWRHRIRKAFTGSDLSVTYKGVIGSDAGAFGNESISASAGYRLNFDVVPENGDTWRLDIGQTLRGAHSLINEGADGGTSFTQTVTGRARIGTGAWQTFSFNVNPGSATSYQPFNQSSSTFLTGTTAESITVEYTTGVRAWSEGTWWGNDGDEAAIRFGANDSLTNNFTAGDYPGQGSRNIITDGWFGSVLLSTL